MTVTPIKPNEVVAGKKQYIPDSVIESWNRVIAKNFKARYSKFKLEELVEDLKATTGLDRKSILDNGWLDLEDIYREAGWEVKFDRPGYNETYAANFTFTAPRNLIPTR